MESFGWTAAAVVVSLAAFVLHKLQERPRIRIDKYQQPSKELLPAFEGEGKYWTSDCRVEMPIRVAKSGPASAKPVTVMEWFESAVRRHGDAAAFKVESSPGNWDTTTWNEYWQDVNQAARAFIHLGLPRYGTISIIGFNRPEYLIADVAAIVAGAKAAGIYATNSPEASLYIANHCKATVVVVENGEQLEKFVTVADQLEHCKAFVVYTDKVSEAQLHAAQAKIPTYQWREFLALGDISQPELNKELKYRIDSQSPGSICTLVYTSGTTGHPKAVMITHDSATWMAYLVGYVLEGWGNTPEHMVSFLPLSHIAAQVLDVFLPLHTTACCASPCTLWFARPDALKGSLGETLRAARPTCFLAVPRVWEKFCEKIQAAGKNSKGLKKAIATWSKSKGLEAYRASMDGGCGRLPTMHFLAEKLVFNKVKNLLGLDRCRACYTAASPISLETMEYMGSLGIKLIEIFGMSECSGAATINTPYMHKAGSVGPPGPGIELILEHVEGRDKPGEGEILFRSRSTMAGYMDDPEKSAAAIDSRGFLHSGDVGRIENGFVFICGRIKELIITAGGENVAPVPIEHALLKACPALSNCIMIGDHHKYNVILVTLKCKLDDGKPTDELDGDAIGVSYKSKTVSSASEDPEWQSYIQKGLDEVNAKAVSRAQRLQKFAILPRDFSVDGGEITPSLKLCRPKVVTKYHDVIERLYK